jgi:hypothetical protein
MATTLTWKQVNAWRLSQHGLRPRLNRHEAISAVTRTGGLQAQVFSVAELALWARVQDVSRADIHKALWHERTLVKTWAMRGTLHLLATSDLPLYVAARGDHGFDNRDRFFAHHGITSAQVASYLNAVPDVLSDQPMTREAFASAVAEQIGVPKLREAISTAGWGSPLKPSAFSGDLCFGPSQGQNITLVNPRKWLGERWQAVEPSAALQEVAQRYLRTYGPATARDFCLWWGGHMSKINKVFRSLGDVLAEVDVEG